MGEAPPPGLLEELELKIEKLVAGGDGLGRVGDYPVFVARSAPGDRLRVRLWQRKPDYGRAEIVEIVEPGPDRREPPCPYFDRCGGCDLQHLEDAAQLRHKVAAARETLERLGGVRWPDDARVIAGDAWAYRLRARFHRDPGDPPRVGYMALGSNRVVPVDRCPILLPPLESVLRALPPALVGTSTRRVDVTVGGSGEATLAPPVGTLGRGPVSREVGGFVYWYDARTFFQGHAGLLEQLVEAVVGSWSGDLAYDLFAGVGLFSLPLALRYGKVVAVEGERIAVRYQRRNLRDNAVAGVEIASRAVESWIRTLPADADRVVVDPPRSGLPGVVRRTLREKPPRRLTYVSCHPATLARDLRAFGETFRLDGLTLLDLFPQTGHVELVAQLVR